MNSLASYSNDDVYYECSRLFDFYEDNTNSAVVLKTLACLILTGVAIASISIIYSFQLNDDGKSYRHYLCNIIISLLYSIPIAILLLIAFIAEYKIDLPDDKIHIYDYKIDYELKKNLKFMYRRKIYLVLCSLFTAFGIIIQFYIGYLKHRNYNTNKENKILLPLHNLNTQEKDLNAQERNLNAQEKDLNTK